MSRLEWFETNHGWRAGAYDIELAAPELWVGTRRTRRGRVEVVGTSGSLRALKARVDRLEQRRRRLHRSLGYLAGLVVSALLIVVVLAWEVSSAAFFVTLLTVAGLFTAHRTIDCLIDRSWESIRLTYQ